jgi:hypothetical protein
VAEDRIAEVVRWRQAGRNMFMGCDIDACLAENRRLRRLVISLRTACEFALDTRDLGDLQRAIDASAEVRSEVAS